MAKVQVYKINNYAQCKIYGCHDKVELAVGDPRFDIDSIFLCEKHAKQVYEQLRSVFNANMVGDDDPQKQTELYQSILVDLIEKQGDKFNNNILYGILDCLNIEYKEDDIKSDLIGKSLKFLKGGNTDGR
jgi:hypothetical protein